MIKQQYIGSQVKVRYLPNSKLLLSITLLNKQSISESDNQFDLTDLELTIVRLMVEGLSDKLIARELKLEPATVRTYNTALYRKLDVRNRKQASVKAKNLGLMDVN